MNRRNDGRRAFAVLSALLLGGAYVAYSSGVASNFRKPRHEIDSPADSLMHGSKSAPVFEDEIRDPNPENHHEILMQTTKSGRIFRSPQDPVSQSMMRSSKLATIEHPFVELWDKMMGPPADAPASEPPEIAPTP